MLSKWSKMLGKNLSKKSNGLKSASDLQDEMLLKQRQVHSFVHLKSGSISLLIESYCLLICSISEVMDSESWDLKKEIAVSVYDFTFICSKPLCV